MNDIRVAIAAHLVSALAGGQTIDVAHFGKFRAKHYGVTVSGLSPRPTPSSVTMIFLAAQELRHALDEGSVPARFECPELTAAVATDLDRPPEAVAKELDGWLHELVEGAKTSRRPQLFGDVATFFIRKNHERSVVVLSPSRRTLAAIDKRPLPTHLDARVVARILALYPKEGLRTAEEVESVLQRLGATSVVRDDAELDRLAKASGGAYPPPLAALVSRAPAALLTQMTQLPWLLDLDAAHRARDLVTRWLGANTEWVAFEGMEGEYTCFRWKPRPMVATLVAENADDFEGHTGRPLADWLTSHLLRLELERAGAATQPLSGADLEQVFRYLDHAGPDEHLWLGELF